MVEGLPERAHKPVRIRENSIYRHCKAKIAILKEVSDPFPRCDNCSMYIMAAIL